MKPDKKPTEAKPAAQVTAKRLVVEQLGLNHWRVTEETVAGVVESRRVLQEGGKVSVADAARLWHVETAGPNRTGDPRL